MGHAGDRTFQSSMVSAAVSKLRASNVPLRKKGEFPETEKKKAGGPQWRWEWGDERRVGDPQSLRKQCSQKPRETAKKKKKCLERLQIVDNFSIAGAGCLRWEGGEGWWQSAENLVYLLRSWNLSWGQRGSIEMFKPEVGIISFAFFSWRLLTGSLIQEHLCFSGSHIITWAFHEELRR